MEDVLIGCHKTIEYYNGYDLSPDRPLVSIDKTTDFYGHAFTLKKYAGYPVNQPLHCNIQHAFSRVKDVNVWENEQTYSCFLSQGYERSQWVFENLHKLTFAIGPNIYYVPDILSDHDFMQEKKRLGKSLLVYPLHSTHHLSCNYEIDKVISKLKELSHQYDTIRICSYWRDIQFEQIMRLEDEGFEITTAGHIYDPLFLHRHKLLLKLATDVCSVESVEGTHVPYSIYFNRPVFVIKLDNKSVLYGLTEFGVNEMKKVDYDKAFNMEMERVENSPMKQLYSYPPSTSFEIYDYFERLMGYSQVRSALDIKNIIDITSDCKNIQYFDIETIKELINMYNTANQLPKAHLLEKEYRQKLSKESHSLKSAYS